MDNSKKKLLSVFGAIIVVFMFLFMGGNSRKTINLNKYIVFDTAGCEGYGVVRADVDWKKLEEDYGKKIKFTKMGKKQFEIWEEAIEPIFILEQAVDVRVNNNKNLSNGDNVSYTWNVNEDVSEYVKCKLKFKNGTYKIKGLKEVKKFDAFEKLKVSFLYTAPYGKVFCEYNGNELGAQHFKVGKYNELNNGDVVKITIDPEAVEECARNKGMVPEVLEKEYIVSGLESYVMDLSQINEETIEKMRQEGEDAYNAMVARDFKEGESLEKLDYLGTYFLKLKDKNLNGNKNILYLVYRGKIHNTFSYDGNSYDKVNDHYWCIRYTDLKVDADNQLINAVTDYKLPRESFEIDTGINAGWWSNKKFVYDGYPTLDELFKESVTTMIDSYNYEENINEIID